MAARERPVVGVDLGGTSVLAAVVDPTGKILGESKRKTNAELGATGVTERVAETVLAALKAADLKRKHIRGIGIGVPGPINLQTGVVANCANLGLSWTNYALRDALSALLDLPVTVDNDVNVGAVGEYSLGAGRGARNMLAIFVGTGIGGGLVIDGQLHGGVRNSSGEVGHMVILADGPLCGCGERGHAEALASRTAIERDIRVALESGRSSVVSRLLEEKGAKLMSAGIIGDAYDAGDAVTVEAVQHAQYYLGLLVSACVNLLDPEVVVLGGGVLERFGDAYLDPVRQVAQQHYINKTELGRVRLVRAALGDYSGALGAAMLAQQRLT
jgi:glucokinase